MNKTILIIVIVFVAIAGGYFLLRSGYQAPEPEVTAPEGEISLSPSSEVKEVTIIGTEFFFSPSQITLKAGEKIKITFENQGGAPHNLVIDGFDVQTKIISKGQKDIIEFIASRTGKFDFFCSVPGHREAGMKGMFKVE